MRDSSKKGPMGGAGGSSDDEADETRRDRTPSVVTADLGDTTTASAAAAPTASKEAAALAAIRKTAVTNFQKEVDAAKTNGISHTRQYLLQQALAGLQASQTPKALEAAINRALFASERARTMFAFTDERVVAFNRSNSSHIATLHTALSCVEPLLLVADDSKVTPVDTHPHLISNLHRALAHVARDRQMGGSKTRESIPNLLKHSHFLDVLPTIHFLQIAHHAQSQLSTEDAKIALKLLAADMTINTFNHLRHKRTMSKDKKGIAIQKALGEAHPLFQDNAKQLRAVHLLLLQTCKSREEACTVLQTLANNTGHPDASCAATIVAAEARATHAAAYNISTIKINPDAVAGYITTIIINGDDTTRVLDLNYEVLDLINETFCMTNTATITPPWVVRGDATTNTAAALVTWAANPGNHDAMLEWFKGHTNMATKELMRAATAKDTECANTTACNNIIAVMDELGLPTPTCYEAVREKLESAVAKKPDGPAP